MPTETQIKNRKGWDIIWRGGWVAYNHFTKQQYNLLEDKWAKAVQELELKENILWY